MHRDPLDWTLEITLPGTERLINVGTLRYIPGLLRMAAGHPTGPAVLQRRTLGDGAAVDICWKRMMRRDPC